MTVNVERGGIAPEAVHFEPITVRIREACRLTGIGRSKFYELVSSGDIEVIKIGSMTLVPFEGLRAFVDRERRSTVGSSERREGS